jgi:hypothetical protein
MFKDALARLESMDYLIDYSCDDFMHCAYEGKRLLLENIAGAIREEVFKR